MLKRIWILPLLAGLLLGSLWYWNSHRWDLVAKPAQMGTPGLAYSAKILPDPDSSQPELIHSTAGLLRGTLFLPLGPPPSITLLAPADQPLPNMEVYWHSRGIHIPLSPEADPRPSGDSLLWVFSTDISPLLTAPPPETEALMATLAGAGAMTALLLIRIPLMRRFRNMRFRNNEPS